jgi:acetate kinase
MLFCNSRTITQPAPAIMTAIHWLMQWLSARPDFSMISAIGHRLVHGMTHSAPQRITLELLAQLRQIMPFDPEHLPREIALIEAIAQRYPDLLQVACFDTAFHRGMPKSPSCCRYHAAISLPGCSAMAFMACRMPICLRSWRRLGDPVAASGRVIFAHLGSGASLAAIQDGQCVDTSMGFTPASGLMMSTRSSDLDPGLIYYLAETERMTVSQFQHMVNQESGLLGVSGGSADLRDLLACESTDERAAEALALFCYQVRKWIGSFAAVLGGLDTLVFAGGIGENAAAVRERICMSLGFLGVEISAARNAAHAQLISTDTSRVAVRVMRTDEELMLARSVCHFLER